MRLFDSTVRGYPYCLAFLHLGYISTLLFENRQLSHHRPPPPHGRDCYKKSVGSCDLLDFPHGLAAIPNVVSQLLAHDRALISKFNHHPPPATTRSDAHCVCIYMDAILPSAALEAKIERKEEEKK